MSQRRALVLVGVGVAIIVLALAILIAGNQPTESSTPESKGGVYLHFSSDYQDGAQTKAYLIDSQLYYGVYNVALSAKE